MRRIDLLQLTRNYVREVNAAMLATENPSLETRNRLRTMGHALEEAAQHMTPRLGPAHAARKAKAKADHATEPFRMHWRSTDHVEEIAGWDALSGRTGLSFSTLRSMLSTGRGRFTRVLFDEHGNADNCTIYRVNYEPGIGRPKHEVPDVT